MILKKFFLSLFFIYSFSDILDEKALKKFFHEDNRHIKIINSKNLLAQQEFNKSLEPFDTNISSHYDYKDYPQSNAQYSDLGIKKRFENGISLYTGYRNAVGTQENNNIKTSDQGEFVASLHMPVIELVKGENNYKNNKETTKINLNISNHISSFELSKYYLDVLKTYYSLLQLNEQLELREDLLLNSITRKAFIQKKVDKGIFSKI